MPDRGPMSGSVRAGVLCVSCRDGLLFFVQLLCCGRIQMTFAFLVWLHVFFFPICIFKGLKQACSVSYLIILYNLIPKACEYFLQTVFIW